MVETDDTFTQKSSNRSSSELFKKAFLITTLFLLFLMPILSFDAGITDDERLHTEHGVRLMNYYLGKDTMAATNPIDKYGEWKYKKNPYDYAVNINLYGGFFDMVSAFIYKYISSSVMGEYESKHFLISIAGVGLFVSIGLIAFQLTGSWAAALLALLFGVLSPRLFGHSFNNPKDIPFATAFAFGLYQILLVLQERLQLRWSRIMLLILVFIISIDIRVAGIMLIFYLLFFSILYIIYEIFIQKKNAKNYIKPLLILTGICIAGYLGASLFWPWASRNPIVNPIISLKIFSQLNEFNSYELFEGIRINNDAIPWYFVIKWFYISFPLFLFSGIILFSLLCWSKVRLRSEKFFQTLLIVTSLLVPLFFLIIRKSNLLDDARHLYFVLPSFLSLAAVGWYWLFKSLPGVYRWPAIILCSLMMFEPFAFMWRNHPHEAMYFSPMIGGTKGAFKNYEMDYWGISLKAGLNWLDNTDTVLAKGRKTKVRLWYGEQLKIKYYTDKSKHLQYVLAVPSSPDWDYSLVLPAESKNNASLLANWPPANTIHQILVDDVPLSAIVRNPLSSINSNILQTDIISGTDPNDHMGRGMIYYNTKNYNKAIVEFKLLIAADSTNKTAYNNIVATYNLLGMYIDALALGNLILDRYPDFQLLKNNLAITKEEIKKLRTDAPYYTAVSYNYFAQGEYKKCIDASMILLTYDPKSAIAYNNICASNNALGNFKAGKAAGDKAHQLSPDDQLIKNNLAVSEKGLRHY
jgi:tetratricopeptide (TPR) repeat protein